MLKKKNEAECPESIIWSSQKIYPSWIYVPSTDPTKKCLHFTIVKYVVFLARWRAFWTGSGETRGLILNLPGVLFNILLL